VTRRQGLCALALALTAAFALDVTPAAANSGDLGLTLSAPPKVKVGQRVTYNFTVANAGPQSVEPEFRFTSGHGATNTLPSGSVHTVSESTTKGGCNNDGHGVVCRFGFLEAGTSATVSIVVDIADRDRPKLSLQATVKPEHQDLNSDPNPANDHLDIDTRIANPITVTGLPSGCLRHKATVKIQTAVANAGETKATVDGKVADKTRGSRLSVKIEPGELDKGSHKLAVTVQGKKGPPLAELRRKFKTC
jgi:uncharacterized repeat protein (TIGR01451 family)